MRFFCMLFALSMFSCGNGHEELAKTQNQLNAGKSVLTKVITKSVSFRIETFHAISCEDFHKQFSTAETSEVLDEKSLAAIGQLLLRLEQDKQTANEDVRAKSVLYYGDNSTDTLCISTLIIKHRGKLFKQNNSLLKLLKINPSYLPVVATQTPDFKRLSVQDDGSSH